LQRAPTLLTAARQTGFPFTLLIHRAVRRCRLCAAAFCDFIRRCRQYLVRIDLNAVHYAVTLQCPYCRFHFASITGLLLNRFIWSFQIFDKNYVFCISHIDRHWPSMGQKDLDWAIYDDNTTDSIFIDTV
jgi:hypothetical protein